MSADDAFLEDLTTKEKTAPAKPEPARAVKGATRASKPSSIVQATVAKHAQAAKDIRDKAITFHTTAAMRDRLKTLRGSVPLSTFIHDLLAAAIAQEE